MPGILQEEVFGDSKLKRTITNKILYICLILFVLIFSCLIWYGLFVDPHQVEVQHLWVQDAGLGDVLKGLTAIHISDLHINKIGKREQMVLELVEEIQPDFVFLTGDYVKWDGDYEEALNFLSRLKAKVGIWAVMGDYDYSRSRKSCLFCHEAGSGKLTRRHEVQFLQNAFEQVVLDEGSIGIAGIDKEAAGPFAENEHFFLEHVKIPVILLSHSPLTFDLLNEDQEVLILAGDTHGGQFLLPPWLWKILGYEKNAKYNYGLFEKGRKKMFVSKGVGTSHIPIRLFSSPEVVVLHFK